jgi:hypothetical protein
LPDPVRPSFRSIPIGEVVPKSESVSWISRPSTRCVVPGTIAASVTSSVPSIKRNFSIRTENPPPAPDPPEGAGFSAARDIKLTRFHRPSALRTRVAFGFSMSNEMTSSRDEKSGISRTRASMRPAFRNGCVPNASSSPSVKPSAVIPGAGKT